MASSARRAGLPSAVGKSVVGRPLSWNACLRARPPPDDPVSHSPRADVVGLKRDGLLDLDLGLGQLPGLYRVLDDPQRVVKARQ